MEETGKFEENEELIVLQKYINYIIAILLLTGQLTITGVFVKSGGISFSLGGPIIGSDRIEARQGKKTVNLLIGVIDIILALLLLAEQIGISSVVISAQKFFINVTGPILGEPKVGVTAPILQGNVRALNQIVPEHLKIDEKKLENLAGERKQ
ncbi:hypothetical protein [Metabacillus fastidiosus]|uniref:Uncharacterized protein n=1 Tax=Metabacillus fastidiosus TaxID=1458 RepID=A0ABU6P0X7_9BACI|nr:hypothetical protein [Metabacillus fastidiosus]